MYILFLAHKYLRRRISALAAVLAVTFGVATLFTVLSVMEGYKMKLRELVRGLESHLTLLSVPALSLLHADQIEEAIHQVPHVRATAPFIETIVMYKSLNGFSYFRLQGIEPEKEGEVGDLRKHLIRPAEIARILPDDESPRPDRAGLDHRVQEVLGNDRPPLTTEEVEELFSLEWRRKVQEAHRPPGLKKKSPSEEPETPPAGLVVGINLLLDREAFIGDELKLITLSPDGGDPLMESFLVVGGFKSGEFETDSKTALARIGRVQNFLHLFVPAANDSRVEGIRIALDDYRNADPTRTEVLRALAGLSAGRKLEEVADLFTRIVAGLTAARVEELAEDLRRQVTGANLIPPGEIEEAITTAAAGLAEPAIPDQVKQYIRQAFDRQIVELGLPGRDGSPETVFNEFDALQGMAIEGMKAWQEALLPEVKLPPTRIPGEALKLHAGRVVLNACVRELDRGIRQLAAPQPLWAQVKTWEEQRRIFIQAVDQEKWIVGFLVFLLDVFIGFVVLLMLVLLVIEKTRDIGILLALGAKPRGVVWVFLAEGLVVVALGVVLGLLGGYFFVRNINPLHDAIFAATGFRLFDPEIYQMDRIPTTVTASEVMLSIFPTVVFGFLASLVPAIWASHQDPIKAIHYE